MQPTSLRRHSAVRVKLALVNDGGHVRVTGSGTADVQLVRKAYDVPLLAHVNGSTDWRLTLDAAERQVAWTVESTLAGAAVDLPAPIGKPAGEALPVRIERHALTAQEDRITVDYGRLARVLLHRQATAGAPVVDRALVLVGRSIVDGAVPAQSGVWIRADLASLDVDQWLGVDVTASNAPSAAAGALAVNGVDLRASNLTPSGARSRTSARRRGATMTSGSLRSMATSCREPPPGAAQRRRNRTVASLRACRD